MTVSKIAIITGCLIACAPLQVAAQAAPAPVSLQSASPETRMNFARDFLSRIKKGYAKANDSLREGGRAEKTAAMGLPDGEELLFRIRLQDRLSLESPILARVKNGGVLLSLRDFVTALEFPITYSPDTGRFDGWYIREKNVFSLDANTRTISTEQGTFTLSDKAVAENEDIFVSADELAQWFGFTLALDVSYLDILLTSPVKLPIQERLARKKHRVGERSFGPAELPLLSETPKIIDIPFVDVATNSRYRRNGDSGEATNSHTASILSSGDFMGGNLSTASQLTKEEKLTSFRAKYKQESLKPELLGPLQARKYEIGDVQSVDLPLDTFHSLGTGARVTNVHPLRSTSRPDTQITGTAFPGWDVELYRENALIAYQTVGDDGIYRFDNVELFRSDNNFRVVFYGPQGEQREENLYIPVDGERLSDTSFSYDVSINRQNKFIYEKIDGNDEDEGAPNLVALVEKPISRTTALSAALESGSRGGDQMVVGHAGISTILSETLLNLSTAVENTGEMASELVARRNIGEHQLRSETDLRTEKFGLEDNGNDETQNIVEQRFSVTGPIGFEIQPNNKPRYNLSLNYGLDGDGYNNYGATAGVSGSWNRLSLSQELDYLGGDRLMDDTLNSITTLNGYFDGNRLRFVTNYNIVPEGELDSVLANVRRFVDRDVELDLTLQHYMDPKLTEGRGQVNWRAGFATISPGITYNSDNDLTATLATRFGLAKDPQNGEIRMFDRGITTNGGVSAFVFLDKDGNNAFNDGDEPLPDVVVRAPQNSGRAATDEEGYAFFNRLANLRLTDVFVDETTLQDPFWITGNKGSSVLPREGHISALQFPIHVSGEIDGYVNARDRDGNMRPLRGITISLYKADGEKVMTSVSESDGFYLLSKVPPGDYFLNVDTLAGQGTYSRPAPQPVKIGYEGTTLYGKNIYFDEGYGDVPYAILAKTDGMAVDPKKMEGRRYVLNLGSFNSRLTMGLAWYKMRAAHGPALAGASLLEKPSESYVDVQSKKHVLRVTVPSDSMAEAERRCAALNAKKQSCVVEILPGGLPQQAAIDPPPPASPAKG